MAQAAGAGQAEVVPPGLALAAEINSGMVLIGIAGYMVTKRPRGSDQYHRLNTIDRVDGRS